MKFPFSLDRTPPPFYRYNHVISHKEQKENSLALVRREEQRACAYAIEELKTSP